MRGMKYSQFQAFPEASLLCKKDNKEGEWSVFSLETINPHRVGREGAKVTSLICVIFSDKLGGVNFVSALSTLFLAAHVASGLGGCASPV